MQLESFKLHKNIEYVGCGLFSWVYKISPRKVIKIYKNKNFNIALNLAKDEIENVKNFNNGLPVLKVVKVKWKDKISIGLIKRYLPLEVSIKEALKQKVNKKTLDYKDFDACQYRKDYKGNIYRVDTQHKPTGLEYLDS